MKYIPTLLFTLLFFACQSNEKSTDTSPETISVEETADKIIEKRGDMTITKIKPTGGAADLKSKEVIGIYFSATVYAGSTDYFFKNPKGETFSIRQTNLVEEQTFKLPKGMLESGAESVPGANKGMIGKRFRIKYDEKGAVASIQLLN